MTRSVSPQYINKLVEVFKRFLARYKTQAKTRSSQGSSFYEQAKRA